MTANRVIFIAGKKGSRILVKVAKLLLWEKRLMKTVEMELSGVIKQ